MESQSIRYKVSELQVLYNLPYRSWKAMIEPIQEELKLIFNQRNLTTVQVLLIFGRCGVPKNLPEKYQALLE